MHELSTWIMYIAILLVIIACIIAISSLIKFSTILVKLLVLELLTNLLMASTMLWAVITHQPVFTDICLTLALIMFLGAVAFFYFLSYKGKFNASSNR